jgi:hypothetical protein
MRKNISKEEEEESMGELKAISNSNWQHDSL